MDEHHGPKDAFSPGLPGQEAYLEAVYVLTMEEPHGVVRAARVAEYLDVSAVSVSRALTRLEKGGELAARTPSLRLSELGTQHAEAVIRRHRMAERWLADKLGLSLVEAHREAERLEHALSDRVVQALWEDLGHPTTCPHGNPIPGYAGPLPPSVTLWDADPGHYVVDRLYEQLEGLEALLEWVDHQGLLPERAVTVRGKTGAARLVQIGEEDPFEVASEVASRILLRNPGRAGQPG